MGYVKLVNISAKKKSLNLTNPNGAIEMWKSDLKSWNLAFLKKQGKHGWIHIKMNIKNSKAAIINIKLFY